MYSRLLIIISIISSTSFGQQPPLGMTKVLIESNLSDDYFSFKYFSYSPKKSTMITTNMDTGKSDTIVQTFKDSIVTQSAAVFAKGSPISYSKSKSFLKGDTVVIQLSGDGNFSGDLYLFLINGCFFVNIKGLTIIFGWKQLARN